MPFNLIFCNFCRAESLLRGEGRFWMAGELETQRIIEIAEGPIIQGFFVWTSKNQNGMFYKN